MKNKFLLKFRFSCSLKLTQLKEGKEIESLFATTLCYCKTKIENAKKGEKWFSSADREGRGGGEVQKEISLSKHDNSTRQRTFP